MDCFVEKDCKVEDPLYEPEIYYQCNNEEVNENDPLELKVTDINRKIKEEIDIEYNVEIDSGELRNPPKFETIPIKKEIKIEEQQVVPDEKFNPAEESMKYINYNSPDEHGINEKLNKNIYKRPKSRKNSIVCEICGKSFTRLNTLKTHRLLHNGGGQFICKVCKHPFPRLQNLKSHMTTHTGDRPYTCNTCGKSFSRSDILNTHFRTHTRERPFTCNVCDKTFVHLGSLNSHLRVHIGERPYKCDVCQKTFTEKSVLITHTRNHTGEKPYTCEFCKKSFAHLVTLKNHLSTHTGVKPVTCKVCGKSFSGSSNMHRHMRSHIKTRKAKEDDSAIQEKSN